MSVQLFLQELLDYNLNVNDNVISILVDNEKKLNERSVKLINHIINAHHIWNNRIEQTELPYQVWEIHKFTDLSRLNKSNHEKSAELMKDYLLDNLIAYQNTKGELFNSSVRDIIFHVIHHSNYHRAQIASDLKINGIQPPVSDYIFYKRSKTV
jgi:uncharacterized damage-inducible protein DinB